MKCVFLTLRIARVFDDTTSSSMGNNEFGHVYATTYSPREWGPLNLVKSSNCSLVGRSGASCRPLPRARLPLLLKHRNSPQPPSADAWPMLDIFGL